METISDDELLFFGSVKTNLAYHFGSVHLYPIDSTNEFQFHLDRNKLTDNQHLILPNLPTIPIQIPETSVHEQFIPDDLCQPLIKTNLSSRLTGIISGTRSALIKSKSSKWYRLKGCGNNTDGFPIQSVANSTTKSTIRGCAFLHTTYRELFMTNYISQLLASHRIECANTSIGWFQYKLQNEHSQKIHTDIPIVQDTNLNQWTNIDRCCILMETLGNKRLSDHILYGVEQLFQLIISNNQSHPIVQSDLLSLFPSERLINSDLNAEQFVPHSTWFASLSNMLTPIDYQHSDWLHSSSYFSDEIPPDINENNWQVLWKTIINIINNYLQTKHLLSHLLCLLYKRLGFECGSILGLMHYHRISWGTYTDELGVHCNAHPNNFVIKFPSSLSDFFLAPLDFDMSFTEANYQRNQMNDQSFDEIIRLELSAFQLTVGGDSQASSGVTAWIEMPDDQWTSARWLLRDIMLNEFNKTYNHTIQNGSISSFESFSKEENGALQALLRLALIKTMKEIG